MDVQELMSYNLKLYCIHIIIEKKKLLVHFVNIAIIVEVLKSL